MTPAEMEARRQHTLAHPEEVSAERKVADLRHFADMARRQATTFDTMADNVQAGRPIWENLWRNPA